jgi:hypothetical protein
LNEPEYPTPAENRRILIEHYLEEIEIHMPRDDYMRGFFDRVYDKHFNAEVVTFKEFELLRKLYEKYTEY